MERENIKLAMWVASTGLLFVLFLAYVHHPEDGDHFRSEVKEQCDFNITDKGYELKLLNGGSYGLFYYGEWAISMTGKKFIYEDTCLLKTIVHNTWLERIKE
jgi:hypothetical protein